MNKKDSTWLLVFFSCFAYPLISNAGQDLVFLGVLGNDAPAIEKSFDRRVRDALSVNPDYRVWDYLESQDFRRRIGFDEFPVVSRRLVESLRSFSNDSTVLAWVTIKKFSMNPRRKWVFGSEIVGGIVLTLGVYSLRFRDFAFIGDVVCGATKGKDPVFFYPLERGTHITAIDRSEITSRLIDEAAYRSADMISAVVRSEKNKAAKGLDTMNIEKNKEPSISDMFDIPSVEPASVETGRKKTTVSAAQPKPGQPQPPVPPPSAAPTAPTVKSTPAVAPKADAAKGK
jgi:hypothetical protein